MSSSSSASARSTRGRYARNLIARLYENDPALTKLTIKSDDIDSSQLIDVLKRLRENTTVNYLGFDGVVLSIPVLEILGLCISRNKTLKTLDFRHIHFDSDDFVIVAHAIADSKLQTLYLTRSTIGDAGLAALSNVLILNETLKTLYLTSVNVDSNSFRPLVQALEFNNALKELIIENQSFNDATIELLASTLRINASIENLELTGCRMSTGAVLALVDMLYENTHLEQVDMGDVASVDASVIEAVEEMLLYNTTLWDLNLPNVRGTRKDYRKMMEGDFLQLRKKGFFKRIVERRIAASRLLPDV